MGKKKYVETERMKCGQTVTASGYTLTDALLNLDRAMTLHISICEKCRESQSEGMSGMIWSKK